MLATASLLFLSLTINSAYAAVINRLVSRQNSINWQPCPNSNDTNISCGTFTIPLDYNDSSAGQGQLFVAKYAAQNTRAGTIFVNPGGPGTEGVQFLISNGAGFSSITGGSYDIVSWDPRGVGSMTVPGTIDCFGSFSSWNNFWNGSLVYPPLQVRDNFTDQNDLNYFNSQVSVMDQKFQNLGTACMNSPSGKYLKYVGTAATARDLAALADALDGQNSQVNFYGVDYGATLGSYFVNMFPGRVGRVVFDSVESPMAYANQPPHLYFGERLNSTDAVYSVFAEACAASGPSGCPIASNGSTGTVVKQRIQSLIDAVHDYITGGGSVTDWTAWMRNYIKGALNDPSGWSNFADSLASASQQYSNSSKRDFLLRRGTVAYDVYSYQAIAGGDSIDPGSVTTQDVFNELLRVSQQVSSMFAPTFPHPVHYAHRWPVRAVERFTGPWNNKLSNQVLIIGNTLDPTTPFNDAAQLASTMGQNAVLVQQNGFGHSSSAQQSTCTVKILSSYFQNGNLPSGGTVCQPDFTETVFPSVSGNQLQSIMSNAMSIAATGAGSGSSSAGSSAASSASRVYSNVLWTLVPIVFAMIPFV